MLKTYCVAVVSVVLCCFSWISTSVAKPISATSVSSKDEAKAIDYLTTFGYLKEADSRAGHLRSGDEVRMAIKKFQEYANLPITGIVDNKTMEMVQLPRCGVADPGRSDSTRRKRRYAVQGTTWKKRSLTYMVQGGPRKHISEAQVREQLNKAFKEWERVSNLTFTNSSKTDADILVRFEVGVHDDGYPFDGEGGTLAHGFYPLENKGLAGDVHFDNDEKWVLSQNAVGTDFYWTALHEIGHSLGLDHSNYRDAVMYPFYTGFKTDLKLNDDDIRGIRYLYGMPEMRIHTAPPRRTNYPSDMPNPCHRSFDAVFADGDGITHFLSEKHYWSVLKTEERRGPFVIADKWKELPAQGIEAAYHSQGNTTFFKGDRCWVYNGTRLLKGPVSISDEFGLDPSVDSIDAAFVWGANGKTYLFRNHSYWRFNEASNHLDIGYPVHINTSWIGVPNNLDSAITWINGKTYFFKDNWFWLFDNVRIKVNDSRPSKINMHWMKCTHAELYGGARNSRTSTLTTMVLSLLVALLSLIKY